MLDQEQLEKNMEIIGQAYCQAIHEIFEAVQTCDEEDDFNYIIDQLEIFTTVQTRELGSLYKLQQHAVSMQTTIQKRFARSVMKDLDNIPLYEGVTTNHENWMFENE